MYICSPGSFGNVGTVSLPLLPGPLETRMAIPIKVSSMGQIDLLEKIRIKYHLIVSISYLIPNNLVHIIRIKNRY